MFARHKTRALARAALLALAALAPAAHAAAQTPAEQPEPQRRQQGPVGGPIIQLPPGAGATDERAQSPRARAEAAREPAAPTKWEYCHIKGFAYRQKGLTPSSGHTTSAVVRFFPTGYEEVEGANEDEALGNAFAKLGEDGWELTGLRTDLSLSDGNGSSVTVYFFKRPKRQE